jgi:hypothetical protein
VLERLDIDRRHGRRQVAGPRAVIVPTDKIRDHLDVEAALGTWGRQAMMTAPDWCREGDCRSGA